MDARKMYETPEAEVIRFEDDDVITASVSNSTRLIIQSPAPSLPSLSSLSDLF